MINKKYELSDETITIGGNILHRIVACMNFSDVKIGDKGGFIQSEHNLSHTGNCWVYDAAAVFQNAKVFGDAKVKGNALILEFANVCGDAVVCEDAHIFGRARITFNAHVNGEAKIFGNSRVCGNVGENANIFENADIVEGEISGNAKVYGSTQICDNAKVFGNSRIYGNSIIRDNSLISGNAVVCGDAVISGHAHISGNAVVTDTNDYSVYKSVWTTGEKWITYTISNRIWEVDGHHYSGKELLKKATRLEKKIFIVKNSKKCITKKIIFNDKISKKCYNALVKTQNIIDKQHISKTYSYNQSFIKSILKKLANFYTNYKKETRT